MWLISSHPLHCIHVYYKYYFTKPGKYTVKYISSYLWADSKKFILLFFCSWFNHLSGNLVEWKQFDIDYLFSMFIDNIQQILISMSQILDSYKRWEYIYFFLPITSLISQMQTLFFSSSSFEKSSLFQFSWDETYVYKCLTITFVYYKLRVVWGSYRKKLTNASMLAITINFDQFRIFIFSLLFILEVIPMRKLRRIAHCVLYM